MTGLLTTLFQQERAAFFHSAHTQDLSVTRPRQMCAKRNYPASTGLDQPKDMGTDLMRSYKVSAILILMLIVLPPTTLLAQYPLYGTGIIAKIPTHRFYVFAWNYKSWRDSLEKAFELCADRAGQSCHPPTSGKNFRIPEHVVIFSTSYQEKYPNSITVNGEQVYRSKVRCIAMLLRPWRKERILNIAYGNSPEDIKSKLKYGAVIKDMHCNAW